MSDSCSSYLKKQVKQLVSILIFLNLIVFFCSKNPSGNEPSENDTRSYPEETWEVISNPDSIGWSIRELHDAYAYAQTINTAALMIIYDGKVLYQRGNYNYEYLLHSCRKSLLSAMYGIHVHNGNIDLDKTLDELGIDDKQPLSATEKSATVMMLLQARSGVYHPAAAEVQSMRDARPERYSHAPGTFWYYNNWDFNALGTIFEQETGTKIFEEFKRLFADPLEMEDFDIDNGYYVYEDCSIHPAYHFRMTARDMARLGLLFLRNGKWRGRQIIPESWIEESTTSYSDAGVSGGYGYMWWIAVDGRHFANVNIPDGSYSARGYGGQYLIVIPDMDLVIVHRANTDYGLSVGYADFCNLLIKIFNAKE